MVPREPLATLGQGRDNFGERPAMISMGTTKGCQIVKVKQSLSFVLSKLSRAALRNTTHRQGGFLIPI